MARHDETWIVHEKMAIHYEEGSKEIVVSVVDESQDISIHFTMTAKEVLDLQLVLKTIATKFPTDP